MSEATPRIAPREALLALCASLLLCLLLLGTHVLPLAAISQAGGDSGLMAWNLWIVDHQIGQARSPFFTDLVYWPVGARLSKHTLVAGFWPVTLLARLAWGDDPLAPLRTYRLAILLSFALGLALTYLFLRRLGLPALACAAPALQLAFSSFATLHIPHLNHVSMAFLMPLLGFALVRLWERPTAGRAATLGALLAAAVYFSELVAFAYLGLPVLLLACLALAPLRPELVSRLQQLGLGGGLAAALAFALLLSPFALNWAEDAGTPPKARQAGNWSANLLGFVLPDAAHTRAYAGLGESSAAASKGIGGREVFLGFPLLLGSALALLRRPKPWCLAMALCAGFFLLLSLGPALKAGRIDTGWPLPYALLMKVPPFDAGRTPVRAVVLGLFCLTPVAAAGLARLGRPAFGVAVLAWALAEALPPKAAPVERYAFPAALADLAPGPAINVPLSVFDGRAVLWQTFHGHPIGTGFVSRRSPTQLQHVRELDRLLEQDPAAFVRRLLALGFTNVILGPGTPEHTAAGLLAQAASIRVLDLRAADAVPDREQAPLLDEGS